MNMDILFDTEKCLKYDVNTVLHYIDDTYYKLEKIFLLTR